MILKIQLTRQRKRNYFSNKFPKSEILNSIKINKISFDVLLKRKKKKKWEETFDSAV